MKVYIYDNNNYYNRIVKHRGFIKDYGTPLYIEGESVNFNPGDGVNTTFVAGRRGNPYDEFGNYLVVSKEGTGGIGEITDSSWFIVDQEKQRSGQYLLKLRRDLANDYYDTLITSKCFIEKATISENSPFIYNQESIVTNQIKTDTIPLTDETKSAWLVGYIARNTPQKELNLSTAVIIPDIEVDSLENWIFYKYLQDGCYALPKVNFRYYLANAKSTVGLYENFNYIKTLAGKDFLPGQQYLYPPNQGFGSNSEDVQRNILKHKTEIEQWINDYGTLYYSKAINFNDEHYLKLFCDGKVIKAGDKYYKIQISVTQESETIHINSDKQGEFLKTKLTELFTSKEILPYYDSNPYFELRFNNEKVTINLKELSYGNYSVTIPSEENRLHLKDAPYDMFVMPYSDDIVINGIKMNKSLMLNIASEIGRNLGSQLYDLQLLPYCPISGYTINSDLDIEMTIPNTDNKRLTPITKVNPVGYIIWATASSGKVSLFASKEIPKTENKKISNQCDTYRLVSPNYNGQFEFNLSKLNGEVSFSADYTYLPYNPYIRVYPNFSGLYGKNFNDSRGLLCQGDFSIAYVSDNWINYQVANKNYQNIFNRQIENMEVNHKLDRINNIASVATGAVSSGATIGGLIGGPVGALIGTGAGILSGIGGAIDMGMAEKRYKENKHYTEDIHIMQLDNIKAQPYSIAKTTAFTINNQIFPILEYYTCTDDEKDVVAHEIANAGMTLGIIDTLANYINNFWSFNGIEDRGFIKGKIIKVDGFAQDSHELTSLDEELQKGLYFKEI